MECEGGVIKRRLAVRNVCNGMVNQSQGGLADCRVGGDGRGREGTGGFSAFGWKWTECGSKYVAISSSAYKHLIIFMSVCIITQHNY